MALLRRGFSIYESLDRVPSSVVRADLLRLGLCPKVSRIQLSKQFLVDAPLAQQNQASPTPTSPPLPDYLKPFSASYLERALRKRIPYAELGATRGVLEMVEMLKQKAESKEKESEVRDLRTLLGKLSAGQTVELSEMKRVLPQLIDLNWLPQLDWSLLRNSNPDSLIPMWQSLFQSLSSLSKDEFIWLLRAVCVNVSSVGMNFNPGVKTLDPAFVTEVLAKAESLTEAMNYRDFAHVHEFIERFHSDGINAIEVEKIRTEVLKRLQSEEIDKMTYSTLNDVFFMLPNGCFHTHAAIVSSLMTQLFPIAKEFEPEYAWRCIETAQRIAAPIPGSLLRESSVLTVPYLSRLSKSKVFRLVDDLISCDKLTSTIATNLIEMCINLNGTKENWDVIIELNYKLHKCGLHSLIQKRMSPAQILATRSNFKLSLEQLLKTNISIFPHICGDSLSRRMLEDLINVSPHQKIEGELLPLLEEMMEVVVMDSCVEKPIYRYQYLSMENVGSPIKLKLAERLAELIIELKGDMKFVWRYYSNAIDVNPPPLSLLNQIHTGLSAEPWEIAFCLWRHQKSISAVSGYAESLLTHPNHNFKSLFYLRKLLSSKSILPTFRLLLSKPVSYPSFFLPLCDELKLSVESDAELKEFFVSKIEKEIRLLETYGDPLYLNIVQMVKLGKFKEVGVMSQCLGFIPQIEPFIPLKTMERLTEALAQSDLHSPLNYKNVSLFFQQAEKFVNFSEKLIMDLGSISTPEKCEVSKEVSDVLMKRDFEMLTRENEALVPRLLTRLHTRATTIEFQRALNSLKPSKSSSDALQSLEAARMLMPDFTSMIFTYMQKLKDRDEAQYVIQNMLSYLATVGADTSQLSTLSDLISKFNLLNSLDLRSLINYAFLHFVKGMESSVIPSDIIERLKELMPIEDEEALIESKAKDLKRFLPFNHTSVLEPRLVGSNTYKNHPGINFYRNFLLRPSDTDILLKFHAIRNCVKQPTGPLVRLALQTLKLQRESSEDVQSFWQDLKQVGDLGRDNIKLRSSTSDDSLKWVLDACLTPLKTGIILYLEKDTVRNSAGTEVRTTYPVRIFKEQLQTLGNWSITGIRIKVWRTLPSSKKTDLLQHIVSKAMEEQ